MNSPTSIYKFYDLYIIDGDLLNAAFANLGGCHFLGCSTMQETPRSSSVIRHTLGIEPRSRNSYPTLATI